MEELTAGLLFNDTMVMIAGGGGVGASTTTSTSTPTTGGSKQDIEFSTPSPCYSSYDQGTSSNVSSSRSSISSSCSPAYYANQLPPELFTEFNEFSAFELGAGGSESSAPEEPFLHHHPGSDEEERSYMEELISSDLSSDEDKFLETIRYGGGAGVVHFSNDLLSEEELVNTIQTYGDVKVVQVDSADVVVAGEVPPEIAEGVGVSVERVFEVVNDTGAGGGSGAAGLHECVVTGNEHKGRLLGGSAGGPTTGVAKKRKAAVGGAKPVKRTLIIQSPQQQHHPTTQHREKKHKNAPQQRIFEEEIIIETNTGELITPDFGSPSPGSPQQQQNHENTSFQELKLSDEEKRLLMKEGISLPGHYPLTKLEERELKRIRRKIRNKISAQDSRKRKKEFLDRLQIKLQEVEDEKSNLQKRCRSLESINTKLNAQVKRLQQALASATSSVQNTVQQHQQKQNVVPAATTLLVLILSLALVVLPTSLDKNHMGGGGENANELISLLNRSNEMAKDQQQQQGGARVLGHHHSSDGKVKSRAMVGEGEDDMDEDDIMDVRQLIGQMKTMLRNKRNKRSSGEDGLLFGGINKRSRFDSGRGNNNNNIRSLVRAMNRVDTNNDGWYASSEDDDDDNKFVPKTGSRFGGDRGGRRFERTHAFQIVDDVEVD